MASCKYDPYIDRVNPYAVLNVTQSSQNISNNTSSVRWELLLYRPAKIYSDASKKYSIVVNGSTVKSGTVTIGGSGTKTIASGYTTVNHNSDGTKSINFSFSFQFDITWSGTWMGTGKANGSMSLSRIPRATTPSVSSSSVTMGEKVSISLPRASGSFTHTLQYDFYSGKWVTFATNVGTSSSLTIPLDWAQKIPNAVSDSARIKCITYNDNSYIGEKIISFTVKVPSSVVPVISNVDIEEAVDGLNLKFGHYVQGKSKLKVATTASGIQGSKIKSYSVSVDGVSYSGSNVITNFINESGTVTVSVSVTDSRGRKALKSFGVTFYEYVLPKINAFSVIRANAQGQADAIGTYANINLNFEISKIEDLNDKSYQIEYKKTDDDTWKVLGKWEAYSYNSVLNGGNILEEDFTYSFRLTVTDYFSSVTAEIDNVPTAFTLINFHRSGNSMAFGGVSERGDAEKVIDVKMDMFDKFGTRINNGMANYTGNGENAIDPDTTSDELVLTNLHTPTNEFMYIKTVFYADKTIENARAQIAIPYSYTSNSIYHRYFLNGQWSPWRRTVNADEYDKAPLWYGEYYMNASQTITLTEPVETQPNGIVLVFSEYGNGTAKDSCFTSFFVKKTLILGKEGVGHMFSSFNPWGNNFVKYLYISNQKIVGNEKNTFNGNLGGVNIANNLYVLRYVYGA